MVEGTTLKDKYFIHKEIGSGAFGKVFMAEDRETNVKFAIKRILRKELSDNEYLFQAFWKELEVMKRCECDNSVKLIENFESSNYYNIVMELCDTDLEQVLNKRQRGFSEQNVKNILMQLNKVFIIMEKENIIHRDLKLRNIMVLYKEGLKDEIGFECKLSDFGFSKVMEDDITRTKLGTPATMAPEIMMNKHYTNKVDLWSVGIIIYQLLFKTLPFRARNEKDLLINILNNNGIIIPDGYSISNDLYQLLISLLQVDPNKRISWKQYFDHYYFNGNMLKNIAPNKVTLLFKLVRR
jgi:serine/threonine protein kinase